ncbi:MAG: hypothetical protein ACOYW7_10035 [Nitrospirota bacterium]
MILSKGKRKIIWSLVAFFLLILFVGLYAQAAEPQLQSQKSPNKIDKSEIKVEGYTYSYETSGKIIVKGSKNNVLYQENTANLQPGMCSNFQTLSKLPIKSARVQKTVPGNEKERWLVILCGSSSGRHQTIKVFSQHPISGLRSASLQFGDTSPNLFDIDGDGSYEAKVYRRIMFPEIDFGLQNYLIVYKLNIDEMLFGFVPVFGQDIAKPYLDYYSWMRESLNQKMADKTLSAEDKRKFIEGNIGPMIAALIATQSGERICAEMKTFRNYEVTIADMQKWERRLREFGLPGFDLTICKEGGR